MAQRRHNTRHAAALAAAAPPTDGPMDSPDMYDAFQAWALKTYGDSAKTKTVTRRKYNRILKILKGEEQTNAENSKFRFWVKAKGFRVGPPAGHATKAADQVLYIPCSKVPVRLIFNITPPKLTLSYSLAIKLLFSGVVFVNRPWLKILR